MHSATGITSTEAPTRELPVDALRPPAPAPPTSPTALPPAPTIVGPKGDACPACGAAMAADQRYCIECGVRRGEPRLPTMSGHAAATPRNSTPPPAVAQPAQSARPAWAAGLSLILGIGVLVLAMGVGVLIGKNGDGGVAAPAPVIIGGTTAATGATAATGSTGAAKDSSKKATAAETDAGGAIDADKTAKANGVKLAPSDVKLGDKCASDAVGCDNGKFNGDFFGGE